MLHIVRSLKELASWVLPSGRLSAARALWQRMKRLKADARAFGVGVSSLASGFELPNILFHFGIAPGDDLLCTAVLRELRTRGWNAMWMVSNYPELFTENSDVARIVPVGRDHRGFATFWRRDFRNLVYAPFDMDDRSTPPSRHIIVELCIQAGIAGPVQIRPYLQLTEEEEVRGTWASGRVVIQSSGLTAKWPMRNKQWYPERFQEVVYALENEYEFIQLGGINDPALDHVIDLRGSTNIRESAGILRHARLYIGNVGFLMHLARAVECPSVILYGGREAPWQSGYICNINLYTPVPCAPCWRWNRCDINRQCMQAISVEDVANAVRQLLLKPRNPLAVEEVVIP
jgi:hypothetical protein